MSHLYSKKLLQLNSYLPLFAIIQGENTLFDIIQSFWFSKEKKILQKHCNPILFQRYKQFPHSHSVGPALLLFTKKLHHAACDNIHCFEKQSLDT